MMKNSTGLTPAQFTHVLDRVTETDIARDSRMCWASTGH